MKLRLAVHVPQEAAGLRAGRPSDRIDPHGAHERHGEHQPSVAYGKSRDVVTATLDGQRETAFPRGAAPVCRGARNGSQNVFRADASGSASFAATFNPCLVLDISDYAVDFINEPDFSFNPPGVKGLGEVVLTGVAPAIANAIYHATAVSNVTATPG